MVTIPQSLIKIWEILTPYINMIYPNLASMLPTLSVMTISIAIYSIIIFHFYKFLAKRDVFKFNIEKYKKKETSTTSSIINFLLSVIKYGLVFPFVVFLWFSGFSIMLFLMAKNIEIAQTLLVSVVFVSSIRLTAYYTEDLSRDLAKMIPFALLGIAIVDSTFFSLNLFFERINSINNFLIQIASYLTFIILVEWLLRILLFLKKIIFGDSKTS